MLNAKIRDIPLPPRMRSLPISDKGFPVPWFVSWVDDAGHRLPRGQGTPDFRSIDPNIVASCHNRRVCWLCGQPLGTRGSRAIKAFVIGPMSAATRTSSEPPSHLDCARYAVRACPFLSQPRARRNTAGLSDAELTQEGFIDRNPGAMVIWVTRSYTVLTNLLFQIGDPERLEWFCQGRPATRAEVEQSIDSGLPLLEAEMQRQGPQALAALPRHIEAARKLLPVA
jgi:hypothetical protein